MLPLPIRRLFIDLPERCNAIGLTELAGNLVQAFTNESVTDENWGAWFTSWESAYTQLNEIGKAPVTLNLTRKNYYLKAITSLAEERPAAALWMLLFTLTRMAALLPKSDAPYKDWQSLARQLTLDTKGIPARLELLDASLDSIEEALERITQLNSFIHTPVDKPGFSGDKPPVLWRKIRNRCQKPVIK